MLKLVNQIGIPFLGLVFLGETKHSIIFGKTKKEVYSNTVMLLKLATLGFNDSPYKYFLFENGNLILTETGNTKEL